MLDLDHQFLVGMGLGHLSAEEENVVERRIYEVLEQRIGVMLASSLTKSEFEHFESLVDDPEDAQAYLAGVVPNYASLVRGELEFIATAIARSVREGAVVIGSPVAEKGDRD